MGLALILIGIILWLTVAPLIGLICVVVGLILLFVPQVPYGYGWYIGRRGPP